VIQRDDVEGEPRFDMLSTIHEYASQRLNESAENDAIHEQYVQFMLDFVKDVEPRVRSAERVRWQRVMQQEHGNVRGALEWVSKTGKCRSIGQQIVITIGWYWHIGGYIIEGMQWCKRMLELCNDQTPASIRAGLLCFEGELGWAQGDHHSALASIEKSLELSRRAGDDLLLADGLTFHGMIALATRDLETAQSSFREGLELYRANHDLWNEVITLTWLGNVAVYQGDHDRAREMNEESIRLARLQGDPWCIMPALMTSAQMAVAADDLTTAHTHLVEAVEALHQSGDQWSLSWTLIDLGYVAFLQENYDQARDYFREGLSQAKLVGNLRALVIALAATAALIAKRSPGETTSLTLAASLCGVTKQYLNTPGLFIWLDTKKIYDDSTSQARSAMHADLWNTGFNTGEHMPIDQAITLAVQALDRLA
jgi:tetratricopeptide (TPR) repeat protein